MTARLLQAASPGAIGTMSRTSRDFQVSRDALTQIRWVSSVLPELEQDQILLKVDQFGFSSNNVTYARRGENLFWKFYPAAPGWFRIPVWGFATVVSSRKPGVSAGERFYGLLPMSTLLLMTVGEVSRSGFITDDEHRKTLPAAYNAYRRTDLDPGYLPDREHEQALLRPVFRTSFVLHDYLADNAYFGARRLILGSASSKTALGVAFLASKAREIPVTGLSARANVPFLSDIGSYDRVVEYEAMEQLSVGELTAYVDMSGSSHVRARLRDLLGETLVFDCRVGTTHGDSAVDVPVAGLQPVVFSMAEQMKKRLSEWGGKAFEEQYGVEWTAFLSWTDGWLTFVEEFGEEQVSMCYLRLLGGSSSAEQGYVLSAHGP